MAERIMDMFERTAAAHADTPALRAKRDGSWRTTTWREYRDQVRLTARGLSGIRLSCQILCDHDMTVRAISRLEGSGRPDPGSTPLDTITPPPVWL